MSEDERVDGITTQEESESVIHEMRWPELGEEPEIDEAILADVQKLIGAQMAEEKGDG